MSVRALALGGPVRIDVLDGEHSPPPAPTEAAAWQKLCTENPALHDGPILSVRRVDPASGAIVCAPDRYRRLAVQRDAAVGELGVRLLGIKGMVTGADRSGREHILLARRGPRVFAYPGLWEIGPAGGVDLPAPGRRYIGPAELAAVLIREGREELGIDLDVARIELRAVVLDETARSVDLIAHCPWPAPVSASAGFCQGGRAGWECVDAAWLTRAELRRLDRDQPGAISPPARAALELLGWL